ncbi:hypothetical protein SH580_10285 [Coraliomargarita algicola]|uniref:Uncharacterized protein n=1 Tax=Coraliomargarita algicola TaxID=3092156 RepID=A0ABZ0RPR5_9BACT|nr:hypothetical protein [Coraliomargarita sp. J2-16]WPJ98087.1 hypothetical protein SH580_10285 [Coraliomargarita sp. J2-16]
MKKADYFVSRIVKLGELNQDSLMEAICKSPIVTIGKFNWTITNVTDERASSFPFVFGRLSKYSSEGHVTIVDPNERSEKDAVAPNLLIASAPFVYLPEHSGLAFMPVWNGIQRELFPKRFKAIVEAAHNNFFAECSIETISDYRAFTTKLKNLSIITDIDAKVHPPNPRFGRLWESLHHYVKKRKADEVKVEETTKSNLGLQSQLINLIEGILEDPTFEPIESVDIADAAVLMAADGYGYGKVTGMADGITTVVKTSDTHKCFKAAKEPEASELAMQADRVFRKVKDERDMDH